jgi:outer membrane protein insertion porin family
LNVRRIVIHRKRIPRLAEAETVYPIRDERAPGRSWANVQPCLSSKFQALMTAIHGHTDAEVPSRRACRAMLRALLSWSLIVLSSFGTLRAQQNPPATQVPPAAQEPPTTQKPPLPAATPTPMPPGMPATSPDVEHALAAYEGQHVSSVELAGRPGLNTKELTPLLAQKPDEAFSQKLAEESVAALEQTGKFSGVQLEILPEVNGLRVMFVLQPAIYIGIYVFPGAEHYSYSRLLQVTNYPPRGPYSPASVENARAALEKYFHETGYFLAKVQSTVEVDQLHGLANIYFQVELGKRARFGTVDIEGATPEQSAQLQRKLRSFMARLRGSAIRPGKTYKLRTLQNATNLLERTLTSQNHLAANVRFIGASYDPESNRAAVKFHVEPGPLINVKVEGARLWPWTRRSLLPEYQQAGIDPQIVQEGRQNLVSYFQSKGYFGVTVDSNVQQNSTGQLILYQVTRGKRHSVEKVTVEGAKAFSESQLLSAVPVKKARFLSRGKYNDKLVRTAVTNITNIYKAEGFSSVRVNSDVTSTNGNIAVTFHVDEGPRDIVQTLTIEGNNTLSAEQFAPNGLKLAPGQPYSQAHVNDDRTQIMSHYLDLGYLNASFRERLNRYENDPHRLDVVYEIREGPQVRTEQVITLGRVDTRQKLVDRYLYGIKPGAPLRTRDLLQSTSQLYQPGIFDWAEVDPRRQVTTQTQEDVVVKLHEAKKNVLTYGFGFEIVNRGGSVPSGTVALPGLPIVGLPSTFITSEKTFYGPNGSIDYTRRNLFGKADSLSFTGYAGRLDQRGGAAFSDPYFRWSKWQASVSLTGEHDSQNPIYTSVVAIASFQLQRPLDVRKTRLFTLRYSYSKTDLTEILIPDLVPPQDQHVRLSTVSASYTKDTRDNPLDAHRGVFQNYEVDLNPTALGSNFNFAALITQNAYYKQIPYGIIWANNIRIGLEQPFAGSSVPLSSAFFSGGASTLRGFPLDGAGPQRTVPACGTPGVPSTCGLITVPVGGNQLVILNSELRIPIPYSFPLVDKNVGIALFYDGGNVYSMIGFHDFLANYTNSVGGGIRYRTPVGPIRLDVGHNLNPVPGIKSTQIFVTLGQAF